MSDPLLAALRADSADGPVVIAVTMTSAGVRDTAAHRHARGQLFGAHRGLLTVGTAQGRWVVPATDAVWVPPQAEHSLRSHGAAFSGWSVYVAGSACAALPARACALRVSGLLREAVARAAQWPDAAPLDPAQTRLAQVLLDEIAPAGPALGGFALSGLADPAQRPIGLPMPSDPRLLRVAQALADDPADPRSLADWAEFAHLSERSLSRRFAAQTGQSLLQWRQRARLMRALERLAAGDAVTAIALDLGYDSVSAFIAMFRRSLGATPAAYQKRLGT
ncbi:bacterial regulatory helix-turn-helix s, AraC family protein [Lysobacter antibioticus]|uniref:AraC family transcriptional regulator n=1 Tax=Lysobacter antibioticus TaxID=84531 RepID=UPI000716F368|nr:helix-turn-helix transcriptional regulator [Lysobacter antibioticus]ALN63094.1 bacterial regulatory helix-turn-helix s, AraC family protein [Lysobacter antibioticus]